MDISIQKNTTVSLHQQLSTQIAMQIAAGILKPGSKLPSIRALSQKLGIHHNTCLTAYQQLEKNGLILIRHGSGAQVAVIDSDIVQNVFNQSNSKNALDHLAAFFVQQVYQQGYRWDEAVAAVEKIRMDLTEQSNLPLIFVDIHSDILPVFQAELQDTLKRPVQIVTLAALNTAREVHSHFIVSRYHYKSLKNILLKAFSEEHVAKHVTVIDVGAVSQELNLIKQLPDDALACIISKSTIILQQAEAVIKALRGDSIFIRPILADYEGNAELQRILKRSQAIFSDWLCLPGLTQLTKKPIHVIRAIPEYEFEKLKRFQH